MTVPIERAFPRANEVGAPTNRNNSSPSSNDGTALSQKIQALIVRNSDSITTLSLQKPITKRRVHVNTLYERFKETSWVNPMNMILRLTRGPRATIQPPILIFKNNSIPFPIRGFPEIIPGVSDRS